MKKEPRIIVALDQTSDKAALDFAAQLDPQLCRVKIGNILFTHYGPPLLEALIQRGFSIFLDLKFHDIPQTVAGACRAAATLGVWMINVHISGGREMLIAAHESLQAIPAAQRPLLVGVTVLTSLTQKDLSLIGLCDSLDDIVLRFAKLAQETGLDGVVCSAQEAALLRKQVSKDFLLVTPGIRLTEDEQNDQKRTMAPEAAFKAGADYLVIGRSLTQSKDPQKTLARIFHTP